MAAAISAARGAQGWGRALARAGAAGAGPLGVCGGRARATEGLGAARAAPAAVPPRRGCRRALPLAPQQGRFWRGYGSGGRGRHRRHGRCHYGRVAGAAATTTAPAGTGRYQTHQVPPAATAATATTATATSTGLMADRPATGKAPARAPGVWMPGTAPRPRSASARSASGM